jgi:hypothetical protein
LLDLYCYTGHVYRVSSNYWACRTRLICSLMWPAIIAGSCVEGEARQWLLTLLEGFKSQCCFYVETATRIIQEAWRRVDAKEPRDDWREVCEDFGLKVL